MPDQFITSLAPYFCILALMVAIVALLMIVKNAFKGTSKADQEINEDLNSEVEVTEIRARVASQRCGIELVGTKTVRCEKDFLVTFETEAGESLEFDVTEEFYLNVKEGQQGILATVNGNLYGFYPDEETENE